MTRERPSMEDMEGTPERAFGKTEKKGGEAKMSTKAKIDEHVKEILEKANHISGFYRMEDHLEQRLLADDDSILIIIDSDLTVTLHFNEACPVGTAAKAARFMPEAEIGFNFIRDDGKIKFKETMEVDIEVRK